MKKSRKKTGRTAKILCMAIVAISMMLSVIPLASAEGAAPEGYAATTEIKLNTGEFAKKITGFETSEPGVRGQNTESTGEIKATGANKGSNSYALNFTDGSAMGFKTIRTDTTTVSDWSQAKYIQFYVDNKTDAALELFYIKVGTTEVMLNYGATGIKLFNLNTNKWSDTTVVGNAYHSYNGDKVATLRLDSGFKGYVRIPLNDTNFNEGAAAYSSINKSISWFGFYALAVGLPAPNSPAYLDDFYLVTYNGDTAPAYENGSGPSVPTPEISGYADTTAIQMNDGEVAKLLTGFEEDDPASIKSGTGAISSDFKNNGEKSYLLNLTAGDASGFKSFTIDTSNVNDWSSAKYLQFYINNDIPLASQDLQIFYFKFGNTQAMLNYGATGVKLYSVSTGKWSDVTISENSYHKQDDGSMAPSVKIPAGFKGYLRIPLTDANFSLSKLSDNLSNITWIDMYAIVPGIPSAGKVYMDDFYLVSYEGSTPPAYQDGKPVGGEGGSGDEGGDGNDNGVGSLTLTGVLSDETGAPIENAKITLNGSTSFITNAKGEYQFTGAGSYNDISAVADGATDYGFVAFNITSGETTSFDGYDKITLRTGATGLTVNLSVKSGILGISSVNDGTLAGVTEGTAGNYGDEDDTLDGTTGGIGDGDSSGINGENGLGGSDGSGLPQTGTEASLNMLLAAFMMGAALVYVLMRGKTLASGKHQVQQ